MFVHAALLLAVTAIFGNVVDGKHLPLMGHYLLSNSTTLPSHVVVTYPRPIANVLQDTSGWPWTEKTIETFSL